MNIGMDSDIGTDDSNVNDFLQRIKELGEKRNREDEERARKLEEEILAGREARQARRAERARSLSPQKDSPAGTPLGLKSTTMFMETPQKSGKDVTKSDALNEAELLDNNTVESARSNALDKLTSGGPSSTSHAEETTTELDKNPPATQTKVRPMTTPANKPLAWQKRPASAASSSIHTPASLSRTSMLDDHNESGDDDTPSREEISRSLLGKDPSFFRQSEDRGKTSAALRKQKEEIFTPSPKMALPGMFEAAPTPEPTKNPSPYPSTFGSGKAASFSSSASPFSSHTKSKSLHFGNGASRPEIKDLESHKSDEEHGDSTSNFIPPPSPKGEQGSPTRRERTPSPTKGLGGFVQSAMLRREGSVRVNRFVPTPPTTGLARAGSSTSEKDWKGSLRGNTLPSRFSREGTPDFTEPDKEEVGRVGRVPFSPPPSTGTTRPESPSLTTRRDSSPPASPTKTYNQRRWSPTKATWLNSAIEKLPDEVAASHSKNVFQPPPTLNRSPTREGSFRRGDTSPSRENSLRDTREERIKARLLAQAVPRRNSQATERPDLKPSTPKPIISPKPPSLTPKPEKEEAAEEVASETVVDLEPSSAEPKEDTKEELAASKPTPTEHKRASDLPEKPSQKPVFERFTSNTTPVDPRELRARTQSFDEKKDVAFLGARSQLRPSKTQNYKAPDELKTTILAGKAGLISKGGPSNWKAPNELKERVLAAKSSLQASSGPQKLVRPDPLKEQVASARGTLKQSGIVLSPTKPFVAPKPQSVAGTTAPAARPPMKESSKSTFEIQSAKNDEVPPSKLVPVKQPSAPGRLEKPGGLADRFNPGLAGLLARGPMGPIGMPRGGGMPGSSASDSVDDGEPKQGPELTHMTKSRARGPKRRAPGSKGTEQNSAGTVASRSISSSAKSPIPSPSPKPTRLSGVGVSPSTKAVEAAAVDAKSPPSTPNKPAALSSRPSQEDATVTPEVVQAKPVTPAKSPALVGKEFKANGNDQQGYFDGQAQSPPPEPASEWTPSKPRTPHQNRPTSSTSPFVSSLKSRMAEIRDEETPSSRSLPQPPFKKQGEEDEDAGGDETPISVRQSAALWGSTNSTPDTTPRKPIQLPTAQDEADALENTPMRSRQTPSKNSESRFSVIRPNPPSRVSSKDTLAPPSPQPTVITSNPEQFLAEFFTSPKVEAPKFEFDTTRILETRADDRMEKVHTMKKQMWEVTGVNGKKDPIPEGHDHVLYEDALYLCLHSFMENTGMMNTEVYLWSGEKVSQGTVEEAQLFAKNLARENDGRLIIMQQGREVPNFFSALGGIIITRRGSRARIHDDHPFMLCCRRAQGGIALDEVEMSRSSLCAGFPYLLSTPDKLYLWKGRGAAPDELGAARLMAFDQAVNGEVKEIHEGQETEQFFEWLRGDADEQAHADYWKFKPQCPKYGARVFLVDNTSPSKIHELRPFSQDDLDPTCVYVVDAFFEMYIVLGGRAQSKRLDFQLALQFTSEYAILAASMEDRPFVPLSTIILGGAPREFKALFRRWEDAKMPTEWHPSRRPSLKVMIGLTEAMEMMGV